MGFANNGSARFFYPTVVAILSVFYGQQAHAVSVFSNYATLTYSVSSSADGLDIDGSFEMLGSPDSFLIADNGTVTPSHGAGLFPLTLDTPLSFSVSGQDNAGEFKSQHYGVFSLNFFNSSTAVINVDLTLNYILHAAVAGETADSDVYLDYYSSDYTFSGFDSLNATLSVPFSEQFTVNGSSGVFSFSLNPGESETLSADVKIASTMLAAPVPLPAAVWSFLVGLLGILGFKKRKQPTIA